MSKISEQNSKTMHDNDEEEKQPESEHNDSPPSVQPLHIDNNGDVDLMLDRSTSCFSVATTPSPISSPTSVDASGHHTPRWSMISASPRGMSAQLSFTEQHSPNHDSDASPLQSPSTQSYQPKRIPSAIFASESATAADWSAASNESLFSIHVGNASFSKEELLSDRKSLSSLSPLAEGSADYEGKDVKMSDVSQVKGVIEAAKQSPEIATPASQPNSSPAPQIASFNSPRISNGSVNSCQSFAFPVLVKDVSKKRGSQPQPEKQSESQSQPEPPPPLPEKEAEAKPETPKEISKAAEPSCFTCFSCWPRCC